MWLHSSSAQNLSEEKGIKPVTSDKDQMFDFKQKKANILQPTPWRLWVLYLNHTEQKQYWNTFLLVWTMLNECSTATFEEWCKIKIQKRKEKHPRDSVCFLYWWCWLQMWRVTYLFMTWPAKALYVHNRLTQVHQSRRWFPWSTSV